MALQSLFSIVQTPKIDITVDDESQRKFKTVTNSDGTQQNIPIFYDGDSISGNVLINVKRGSKYEHQGIKIQFIGIIEYYGERASREEFVSLSDDLARPGILQQPLNYYFNFAMVDKPYESYSGSLLRIKYVLRVTIIKRISNVVREREVLVNTLAYYHDVDSSIKMEVGIEESLHIEFEYDKSHYHLNDVIIGKIYFILVRVKIKNMEIHIVKKESAGHGVNTYTENETIAKFEIMDGAPVKGESIPIRLFLSHFNLTPTIHDVQRKFSVRYLLNLVLLDEEERRYYKHQEILIYRKTEHKRKQYATEIAISQALSTSAKNSNSQVESASEDSSENSSIISRDNTNQIKRSMQRYQASEGSKFETTDNGDVKPLVFDSQESENNNIDQTTSDNSIINSANELSLKEESSKSNTLINSMFKDVTTCNKNESSQEPKLHVSTSKEQNSVPDVFAEC